MKNIFNVFVVLLLFFPSHGFAYSSYTIESSHNDEIFIINGERYAAQTYCFDIREGDKVTFLSGSAYGACASAEILNLRSNKSCKVWCE